MDSHNNAEVCNNLSLKGKEPDLLQLALPVADGHPGSLQLLPQLGLYSPLLAALCLQRVSRSHPASPM